MYDDIHVNTAVCVMLHLTMSSDVSGAASGTNPSSKVTIDLQTC